ncbi:hypothetical protein E3E11_02905 [Oecophyllibacter saccharovorans]|uniref:aminotransferase class IV n=1 Tax=Oecophyllibacter saccharovorans TaxID=2558360 RepID=UPI001143F211|nr:aminotransferase class IV [Oecophyllibacter saccharovorans]QDH14986.1 hypothetical protein E3E11_02905 [Oecophyllibacter saccharovorans]
MNAQPDLWAWHDTRLLPLSEIRISPTDRGFLLGDGLFETLGVTQGAPAWPALHFDRLEAGCKLLNLPAPDRSALLAAMTAVLEANRLTEGALRLTWSRGCGPRGLSPPAQPRPTLLITATPGPPSLPTPVRLHIPQQRRDETSPLCGAKTLSMLPSINARQEAQAMGADDALLLNQQGHLCEASAANFLALDRNGLLLTPPLRDGPLPGTARRRLLESGLCREQRLIPHELPVLQSAWLITALGVTEVSTVTINGGSQPISLDLNAVRTHNLRRFLARIS